MPDIAIQGTTLLLWGLAIGQAAVAEAWLQTAQEGPTPDPSGPTLQVILGVGLVLLIAVLLGLLYVASRQRPEALELDSRVPSQPHLVFDIRHPDGSREIVRLGLVASLDLGRDPSCDLVLDDLEVSSRHARLAVDSEGVSITDLGSSNGTFVNGNLESTASLRPRDRVQVGSTRLKIRVERSP